ncbi:glycosyltransferase family 2 protein [Halogeometricum pallidum]|uniref:glycosyltransferase family 2 protein n=1 Tax=Halogeometricum pallidum TaxID=411361 RepID=UPI000A0780C4|nr:glycosyltransferase family 2 protein [Halogeometricum pallidum]
MGRSPAVSVVTPSYNRPARVVDAVKSVKAQTYADIEHIVVDDCSEESVADVLARSEVATDDIIIRRHAENQGTMAARNTGIGAASGEYIAFLDDDDEWHPEKIKRQVERARESGAAVIYTGVRQVADGETLSVEIPEVEGQITKDLLTGNPIKSTSTVMVRADIFDEVDGFDRRLTNLDDWEFYIRASTVAEFAGVHDALVTRHHHDAQISLDYEGARDVDVPLMKQKHGYLAETYGVKEPFYGVLEQALGSKAITVGDYRAARKHYTTALRLTHSKTSIIRLMALSGGKYTYSPAQRLHGLLTA